MTIRPERWSRMTRPAALHAMASAVTLSARVRVHALKVEFEERFNDAIAGIVDQHVDAAPLIDHTLHSSFGCTLNRQVGDDLLDAGVGCANEVGSLGQPGFVDVDNADGTAPRHKLQRHLAPEPTGGTGDQRSFPMFVWRLGRQEVPPQRST